MSLKLIVYTALIGDSGDLWSVWPGATDVQHIAFVDRLRTEVGHWDGNPPMISLTHEKDRKPTWEQRIIDDEWGPRRTARRCKALPHRYMPDADAWIWVDSNIRERVPPQVLMDYCAGDLCAQKHWKRRCVYPEIAACLTLDKGDPTQLREQAVRFRKAGMPDNWGLAATGVLIRRNTARAQALNEAWWSEIARGSARDQVSFAYTCWRLGMRWDVLPGDSPVKSRGDFVYVSHTRRVRRGNKWVRLYP